MAKVARIEVRVCPRKKDEFDRILKRCGLSMSKAFEIFIQKTIINKGMPFGVFAQTDRYKALRKKVDEVESMEEWSKLAVELTRAELAEGTAETEEEKPSAYEAELMDDL